MLRFVFRKMLSKKWMVLSLLIGNILLISITAGNPMYTQAVLQRTLTKNLEAFLTEENAYPGLIIMRLESPTDANADIDRFEQWYDRIPEAYETEPLYRVKYMATEAKVAELDDMRKDAEGMKLSVSMLTDLPEHIEIIAGRMYESRPDDTGVIDAIISESVLIETGVLLDDVVTIPKLTGADGNPVRIRISGVFRNSSSEDIYWARTPGSYYDDCFIDEELFRQNFLTGGEKLQNRVDAHWFTMLDYQAMRGDEVTEKLAIAQSYRKEFGLRTSKCYTDNFTAIFESYIATAKKVNITLWVLQVPIFILLAAFIFMVSRQMLEMEQNEIAVIKSRGAGKTQILLIYLLQSLIISVIAFAAGIPLGVYLCQVLGSSNAFLEFVRRSTLPVEINSDALMFAGLASLLSICTMVMPAMRYSRTSIVGHKRAKNRKSDTPLWQKLFLDVILLGIAVYGLYTFNGQKELLAQRVQEGGSLDPLLFFSSSLFMIGAGLLAVRIIPMLVWVIYRLFRPLWSPALYASFLRVLRTRSSQGFIMVFLIMTIALGVFNAQAARTINQNTEDNLRYSNGADIVLRETWASNAALVSEGGASEMMYEEPDFGRYEELDGAASVARVYVNERGSATVGKSTIKNLRLLGIDTKEFGETAWYKDTLSDIHWYHYLNAMSRNSQAVLVSRNFQTKHGCELGDSISYKNDNGDSLRGVIYGFVDYFPSYIPVSYKQDNNGVFKETENYLIVAHLSQIQSSWGIMPYQIWIKNEDSSGYIYDFASENGLEYPMFADSGAELVEAKNDPVLQGTNGILTVGFIVVLLLCSVGFLIYWILSIQSRSLQFGIFRAMGMSMREVFTMLINEQIFISGLSIATGAVVGHLTAKLYMPLIQLAYAASDNALPLEVISLQSDNIRLFTVVGVVILLCMIILGALISHMKIAQALKLGED